MNSQTMFIAALLLVGCNTGDIAPPPVGTGGLGSTGGTDGGDPSECWLDGADAEAVRWQCDGFAEATIFASLDVEIPDWADNSGQVEEWIEYGRYDWYEQFGPRADETYDDPGVDACCLPTIALEEDEAESEGEDETGAGGPGSDIPQAAENCAHDCADQACRQIPKLLRRMADEVPAGIPVFGKSYRKQLRDLADWTANNHGGCYDAMLLDGVSEKLGAFVVEGQWDIPDSNEWPAVTELSLDGECRIYEWHLPEQGDPDTCTGINGNDDEGTFDPEGSVFGGFDTFVPASGQMGLDGPLLFGVQADGVAPLLGSDACPRPEECSRLDAWITEDAVELQRIALVAPESLLWELDGQSLVIDSLHAVMEHPRMIPLWWDHGIGNFQIPAGDLEMVFAGQIHGVPVTMAVPTVAPITGTVTWSPEGAYSLEFGPMVFEYEDVYGPWTMEITLDDLVAAQHAPRSAFEVKDVDGQPLFDASSTFDPDGDPLAFEWLVDGNWIGEGAAIAPDLSYGLHTLALHATDSTGRSTWSHQVIAIKP